LDTGTHSSLLSASSFIETVESRQGYKVACIEEVAFRNGWISKKELFSLAQPLIKSDYGKYLIEIGEEI